MLAPVPGPRMPIPAPRTMPPAARELPSDEPRGPWRIASTPRRVLAPPGARECRTCGTRHDEATHQAVLDVHRWLRERLLRCLEPVVRGRPTTRLCLVCGGPLPADLRALCSPECRTERRRRRAARDALRKAGETGIQVDVELTRSDYFAVKRAAKLAHHRIPVYLRDVIVRALNAESEP